ncbi:MAG: hypothetical protein QOI66_2933 [Myxococcales bacterium]|jgi:hypothetical protein|nr:hypothetical protein [Myxococcales bacterium]
MKKGTVLSLGLAVAVVVAVAVTLWGCSNQKLDPTPFIGTWRYAGTASAKCTLGSIPVPLAGRAITIKAGTDSDLELEASCYCRLKLQVVAGFQAVSSGSQYCEQVLDGEQATSTITRFSISLARGPNGADVGKLEIGGKFNLPVLGTHVDCQDLETSALTLTRSQPSLDCGPDDTAVGVLPYSATDGTTDCPTEAGRDGVTIILDNEDDVTHPFCSHDTAQWGQGPWVLPASIKNTNTCNYDSRDTVLHLCRVDGRAFKAMTTDLKRTENAYALLKLGKQCPNGSVEMTKTIDTEDATDNSINRWAGRLGDSNRIGTGRASTATLAFCYFTSADDPNQAMTEFPALGFPYAVFHDFDGPQPPWVISKMWHYSDDEDTSNKNKYDPEPTNGFDSIIENANNDTCFDIAHVR